jgi:HAD domain in Swiss Army Knife RNA repair proteins
MIQGRQSRVPQASRLFLDVDGVLNAFDFDARLATFSDFEIHEVTVDQGSGFRLTLDLRLSRSMGQRVGAMSAEIVWATTWEHLADEVVAPLCGMRRGLDFLERPLNTIHKDGTWKFDVVRRSVAEGMRPFIWIDDDIDSFHNGAEPARKWADRLPIPSLLIAPDPKTGLTHGDLEAVEEFLSQLDLDAPAR